MSDRYILDEQGNPIPEDDTLKWAQWYKTADRRVELTQVAPGIKVSTVFLGLDHSWGNYPPELFETLIFGGPHDKDMERYGTRQEAIEGHKRMCELAAKP